MRIPKTVSRKKREANRGNARRSSGPKTRRGKQAARWNALKHGLLSREVVLPAGRENRRDFLRLLGRLRLDLRPRGPLERMLVEDLAASYWRLRRVLRCESGEIGKGLVTAPAEKREEQADRLRSDRRFTEAGVDNARDHLSNTSAGLRYLLQVLDSVGRKVELDGGLGEEALQLLVAHFGKEPDGFAAYCLRLSPRRDQPRSKEDEEADGPQSPWPLLKALNEKKRELEQQLPATVQNEQHEWQSHLATLSLPSREATERIIRYETSIRRHLHRTLDLLERLQRGRSKNSEKINFAERSQ